MVTSKKIHSEGVFVDKKIIMSALEAAVDALLQEEERLVADLELRSLKNEKIIAEIHLKDGKPIFFHFFDRPEKERGDAARESYMKMYRD